MVRVFRGFVSFVVVYPAYSGFELGLAGQSRFAPELNLDHGIDRDSGFPCRPQRPTRSSDLATCTAPWTLQYSSFHAALREVPHPLWYLQFISQPTTDDVIEQRFSFL